MLGQSVMRQLENHMHDTYKPIFPRCLLGVQRRDRNLGLLLLLKT